MRRTHCSSCKTWFDSDIEYDNHLPCSGGALGGKEDLGHFKEAQKNYDDTTER